MNAAIADLQDLQAPEEPKERRFKSTTPPWKTGRLAGAQPAGNAFYRDELIGLLPLGRKKAKGDKAFYLEGWNGTASFNIDRIGRGSLHIKTCASVFGGIQPELLERYLAGITASLDNDGRIQRFQVMVYPNASPWEWRDRYPVKGAREAVRDLFDRLAVFDPVQDGAAPHDDFVKLPHFCFDDAAQDIFVEWCTELHTVHIANEQNPLMQQHFGKFEKLFCSIALILHLAEGSIGPVTATSALRAAAWCEYLTGHARRIYGLVEAAKVTTARMVSRRLAEGKLDDGFTVRDMVRKQWSGVTTAMQAETALAILEENGHVQSQDGINTLARPTVRYYANQIKRWRNDHLAERAKAAIAQTPGGTAKTDETAFSRLLAVSSSTYRGRSEIPDRLSSLAVPSPPYWKNQPTGTRWTRPIWPTTSLLRLHSCRAQPVRLAL
jgi:hypothetical protein